MALQPFIRRGTRSNATARRLVASSQSIAPSVLRTTIERDDIHQPVMRCFTLEAGTLAGIRIDDASHFYLVASKFAGRYYVVYRKDGRWLCSADDERVQARLVRQVEMYRQQLRQKVVA
jgi:hypothetical protein